MKITSTTVKLTADTLPKGNLWEMDGACWAAVRSITNPDEWRWYGQNAKAQSKGQPTGDMFDYYPIVGGLPKQQP